MPAWRAATWSRAGSADAYGHQKLGGVGLALSEALEERTGEGIIYQQVAYLMRSGSPDSLDLMVGTNYAVMAADLAGEGSSGRMVALRSGTYTNVPISVTREGVKRVDVDELYDVGLLPPKGAPRGRQTDVPVLMGAIGVLTAGGDCPGLNAVIRAVTVRLVEDHGRSVVGILNGWDGLMNSKVRALDRNSVRGILQRGGTILGTSRLDPYVHGEGLKSVADCIRRHEIDALVVIGGDGTLRSAQRLAEEGLPVVAVPKTIDNDIAGTDITFGFDTAVQIATEAIDRIATTAEAHNRVMLVEVMGRTQGWIATYAGMAGGADAILIPEIPYDLDAVSDVILLRRDRGKNYSIVVVAEGIAPPPESDTAPPAVRRHSDSPVSAGSPTRSPRSWRRRRGSRRGSPCLAISSAGDPDRVRPRPRDAFRRRRRRPGGPRRLGDDGRPTRQQDRGDPAQRRRLRHPRHRSCHLRRGGHVLRLRVPLPCSGVVSSGYW